MPNEQKKAIIVGGGFGGLEVALYLRRRLAEKAAVTLVSEHAAFVYKPYLTHVPFGLDPKDMRLSLPDLASAQGFRFQQGIAHAVDPERRMLRVSEREMSYDGLFLATGAAARAKEEVPGLRTHGFMIEREDDMLRLRRALGQLQSEVRGGAQRRIVLLVPPGCQWAGALYELAFMLATWLTWKDAREGVELLLLTAEHRFMDVFGPGVHEALQNELKERGIGARRWQQPRRAEQGALVFPEGGRLAYDLLIAAPSHEAAVRWKALPTDERGFLRTKTASRQVESHPDIYAVGDASDYPVKQGFLALLQADAAAEAWAARVLDEKPRFAFKPEGAWLMEQLDQALIAQGPLGEEAFSVRTSARVERLPVDHRPRPLVSEYLPRREGTLNPLYSGLLWKRAEMGLKMLQHLAGGDEEE